MKTQEQTKATMHVSMYVSNLAKTEAHYDSFFGQAANKSMPGYAKYELSEPALVISFVENTELVQANFGHLGFRVPNGTALEEWKKKMGQANIQVLEEEGTNCCYASQDKFWVTDPDGIQWEVYNFLGDVSFNDPKYAMKGEKDGNEDACCSPAMVVKEAAEACCSSDSGCC